ncbi:hypothetical protein COCNU_13G001520 [Cocos nucifera]|uniref:Dilute domain-containing protein n=1 Tax=Cocos nucifera TaxID=13894 RepID=A0A8K0NB47_COCNU|nr:hypothetical protein COCNU_13G001520 [Cocos nucifera]
MVRGGMANLLWFCPINLALEAFSLNDDLKVAAEDSKAAEISKLQKALESLNAELEAAKLATISECNKNALLQIQLELSMKDQETIRSSLVEMAELNKENLLLKSSLESLTKKNLEMEQELLKARECSHDTLDKLQDVESKYLQLRQNLHSLEEKLANLEDENHFLRQKALSLSPRKNLVGVLKPFTEVDNENDVLPYWLSNASALLCLLQRNLRSNGFLTTPRCSTGSFPLSGRMTQGVKSPTKLIGLEECWSRVDARYPAMLFKQQLTACLEKIFGLIRDNLKKEISPLLSLCIQVIHQKRKKSLEDIRENLCPVVAAMRDMVNKDSQNLISNSFLLDDDLSDCSIPFSTEDVSKAIPRIDPTDVELPPSLRQFPSARFLVQPLEPPIA